MAYYSTKIPEDKSDRVKPVKRTRPVVTMDEPTPVEVVSKEDNKEQE
jgi:hypothetical protein|tara:strand:+ start:11409 stop:11549 length:141 start_codon:yes stop_codon:yes gene_type:complete